MQDHNFNFEIQTLLKHFIAAFNDVRIKRYDGRRYAKKTIKVPMTISPKSHIIQDLFGKTDTVKMPIMAVEIMSQGRDNERVKNKLRDVQYRQEDGTFINLQFVPWNIKVNLNVLAKYQEDMDQIIQNFTMNTDPYAIISWQEPKSGRELRTEILWDGDVQYEYPGKDQAPKDPPFRVVATTSFTIKGYLFKTAIENSKTICNIDTEYFFTDRFYCNYDDVLEFSQDLTSESYSISGRPVLRYVAPYYLTEHQRPQITLQGYGFGNVNGVFVSGSSPDMFPLTEYQPNSAIDSFWGYPISAYTKTDNTITFTLPAPSSHGFIDIIATNTCGQGILTEDADRCGRVENPYATTDPEHYSWTVLQFPYLNGLIVSDRFDPLCYEPDNQIYVYEEESPLEREALITKIKELMAEGDISVDELT